MTCFDVEALRTKSEFDDKAPHVDPKLSAESLFTSSSHSANHNDFYSAQRTTNIPSCETLGASFCVDGFRSHIQA